MKILIVDDQRRNRAALRQTLESEEFEVVEASDGQEALETLKRGTPDAVISDVLMPNLDGYSLCRAVRKDPALQNLPFLIYTSTYISPGDEDIALRCGADRYLRKPAANSELLAALKAITDPNLRAQRPTDAPPSENEVLKQYSEILVRKLEQKTLELHIRNGSLEASEERFRQLVENLEQAFTLQDVDGALLYVSPAYEMIWGRSRENLYAAPESWLEAVVPEDRASVEKVLREKPHGVGEFRIVRPDKTVRWIRARRFPIREKAGRIIRFGGIAEDITVLKNAEAQLRQAQKMESVGRLAGGVAHDFNNVLTAISGYTQFLLGALPPGDPRRADAQEIEKAVKRASSLTAQLLAFSRKQSLNPRLVDVNEIVLGFDKMLRRLIGEDIRVETRLAEGLGRCKADAGQIEQVLMNLAVNARDAMPRGGAFRIETANVELKPEQIKSAHAVQSEARPGPHVRLAVSDTGCGMSAEILGHLFEPFFTTKPANKGTGLGLATVYGIVRQCGGLIEVSSETDRGTSFRIYLPIAADETADKSAAAPAPPPARISGAETVLLVEDDDAVRPVARRMLSELGYSVLEALDGDHAQSIVSRHDGAVHLALIDMVMPGASGPEVVQALRRKHPGLRVIWMSGYVDHVALEASGTESFLEKPFGTEELARKIRESLQRKPD